MTRRDLKFQEDDNRRLGDVMTGENLVTAPEETTLDEAERILYHAKVEKLLLVDKEQRLVGMITMRDIDKMHQYPNACKDKRGRLRVGAATGVNDFAAGGGTDQSRCRCRRRRYGHGHSNNVLETVRQIKKNWNIQVIAGNIATAEVWSAFRSPSRPSQHDAKNRIASKRIVKKPGRESRRVGGQIIIRNSGNPGQTVPASTRSVPATRRVVFRADVWKSRRAPSYDVDLNDYGIPTPRAWPPRRFGHDSHRRLVMAWRAGRSTVP